MELWIRSQDKKHLLKVDNIKWLGGELYTNDSVFLETIKDGVRYLLGIYSNGKRALEVFDEIQEKIKNGIGIQKNKSYTEGSFRNHELVIDIPYTKIIVYEMPKE